MSCGTALVGISGRVAGNVRRVFSQVGPGDTFGEMAVIEDKPRSAGATAKTDVSVYFIPRAEMLALVERCPALALALLREISNRLREFNRQYLNEVLQAERLAIIGRFARSIVHDLKNPLNIIGLTAEMAGMDRATPEMRRQVAERIRIQVERINDLIGEILDFTQGAPASFVLAPVDYGAFVTGLLNELGPEAGLKSATLELANPPPSAEVFIHPKRLRRVFFNLVRNATDAMPEGGKILLRFRATDTEVVTEDRGRRTGYRAGDSRTVVRGLRDAWQSPRHRPRAFNLQAHHRGSPRLDHGAQRAGARRGIFLRAAPAPATRRGCRRQKVAGVAWLNTLRCYMGSKRCTSGILM